MRICSGIREQISSKKERFRYCRPRPAIPHELADPLMGAGPVEILETVLVENPLQVTLTERKNVVDALSTNATEKPLSEGVHPGCPHDGAESPYTCPLRRAVEVDAQVRPIRW
jgi:hypothetical protein